MSGDFEDWVRWVFDHPVPGRNEKAWYFATEAETWDSERDPELALGNATRLFERPAILLGRYSENQIGQGLWFLSDPSCSSHLIGILDRRIDWHHRRRAILSIFTLYQDLFANIEGQQFGHLDRGSGQQNAANMICYMFWDICPLSPQGNEIDTNEVDRTCLDVMRRTLAIGNWLCCEGALHGLGHWAARYPKSVAAIIENFLFEQVGLPPELRAYALSASKGQVA